MTGLGVDLARLGELVDRMQRFEAQLNDVRTQLDARIRGLDVTWTGAAAVAQAGAHARWDAAAGDVHAASGTLRRVAATAHANYAAAVLANRRMWSQ